MKTKYRRKCHRDFRKETQNMQGIETLRDAFQCGYPLSRQNIKTVLVTLSNRLASGEPFSAK